MTTCRKIRYSTKQRASAALAVILLRDKRPEDHREKRYYECPRCHGWHLTSRAEEASK